MVAKPALNLDFSDQLVPSDKPKGVIASHKVAWQSSLKPYPGRPGDAGKYDGFAGLRRRGFAPPRNDKGGKVTCVVVRRPVFGRIPPGANPQSFPFPLPYRELGSSTRSPSTYWWIKPEIKLW